MTYELDPLTGDPIAKSDAEIAVSKVASVDLSAIDTMPIDELRTLCKRMACQCGLIARMTREETAQAMLDTLAETALKPIVMGLNMKADIQSRMTAIDKWLDRTEGKATQRIEQKIEYNDRTSSSELTNSQLIQALRQANIAGLLPANMKLLDSGDLAVDGEYEEVTVGQ